jgi:hypothetical protein
MNKTYASLGISTHPGGSAVTAISVKAGVVYANQDVGSFSKTPLSGTIRVSRTASLRQLVRHSRDLKTQGEQKEILTFGKVSAVVVETGSHW